MESDSSNEQNEDLPEEDGKTAKQREKIRQEISGMSFEELQKLKRAIGIKMYNQTVFGVTRNTKTDFKRANKNRPREMSSKKRIKLAHDIGQTKKQIFRDPRFDPACGTFSEDAFKDNYKFLYNMRKREYYELKKEYQNVEDAEERKKIKFVMQRLNNQIREHEKKENEKIKLQQEQNEICHKLKRGEKPIFKKKSAKKLEGLIEQYEDLKKSNKLQKHIEKRSKKMNLKKTNV